SATKAATASAGMRHWPLLLSRKAPANRPAAHHSRAALREIPRCSASAATENKPGAKPEAGDSTGQPAASAAAARLASRSAKASASRASRWVRAWGLMRPEAPRACRHSGAARLCGAQGQRQGQSSAGGGRCPVWLAGAGLGSVSNGEKRSPGGPVGRDRTSSVKLFLTRAREGTLPELL